MQYELLREDAIRPLRSAITAVRKNPSEQEASFAHTIGIYEKVCDMYHLNHRFTDVYRCTSLARPSQRRVWPRALCSRQHELVNKYHGSNQSD